MSPHLVDSDFHQFLDSRVSAQENARIKGHLDACPECAEKCNQIIEARNVVASQPESTSKALPTQGDVSTPARAVEGTPAAVRYRILRPHAKGGQGEVFLAADEELHREIALKEIQERYADQSVSRARFVFEAEITGRLEHPGIVPVYGMGSYADGRPFYAMRFIRGNHLEESITRFYKGAEGADSFASLGFRKLLRHFIDVCNVIAYAHSRGVVHRDLKPRNIMLGLYGETLVVDWGMAKLVEHAANAGDGGVDQSALRPPSADAVPASQAGIAMGTPAFMSPEQAAGRVDQVCPASDVYSLGATLYSVLTGKAPFEGFDIVAMLAQVERGEFPSPRQVNPTVPKALAAVCLKAMALEPTKRYETPLDLAQAVEQWLADEPVNGYAEPLLVRAGRFLRKRKGLVRTATAVLITATVGMAVGLVLLNKEKDRTELARRAEAQRRKETREALDVMSSHLVEDWLARRKERGLSKEQKDFLEKAVAYYEKFANETGQDEEARAGVADAHLRVGHIRRTLGQFAEAETFYSRSVALYAQLAADFPAVPVYRERQGGTLINQCNLYRDTGRAPEAERAIRDAVSIQQQLAAHFPSVAEYRRLLAGCYSDLGVLLRGSGRSKDAALAYDQALTIRERLVEDSPTVVVYRQDLATTHNNLGRLLHDTGAIKDGEDHLRKALDIQKGLTTEFPAVPQFAQELALTHTNLANLLRDTGRLKHAEAAYRDALVIYRHLTAEFPSVPDYQQYLARGYHNLGVLFYSSGRAKEAEAADRDGVRIYQRLAAEFPSIVAYRDGFADSLNNLGAHLHQTGRLKEAEGPYRDSMAVRRRLAREFPAMPEYRSQLAASNNNLAALLYQTGRPKDAESAYGEALKINQGLASEFPTVTKYRSELAGNHNNLGVLLWQTGRPKEAETAYQEAMSIEQRLVADFPSVPEYANDLAGAMGNLANLLRDRKELRQAQQLLEEALPHLETALRSSPRNPTYRSYFRDNRQTLATILVDLGEHAGAARTAKQLLQSGVDPANDAYNAACILAKCVPLADKDTQLAEGKSKEMAQTYSDQALAALQKSVQNGFKNTAHMKADKDLDSLRSRKEFKTLLARLEGKGK
jgi:serine/threonine protein kinase